MEKLLEALREELSKLGLDEKAIEAALQEAIAKAEKPEEEPAKGDPAPKPNEEEDSPTPNPEGDEDGGDVPPADEPPADDVPPSGGDPVPPSEDPVPPVPPTPPVDLGPVMEEISNLKGAIEELKSANAGLAEQVETYKEALVKAGVIEGEVTPGQVGDEDPGLDPAHKGEESLDSVLAEMNRKF